MEGRQIYKIQMDRFEEEVAAMIDEHDKVVKLMLKFWILKVQGLNRFLN